MLFFSILTWEKVTVDIISFKKKDIMYYTTGGYMPLSPGNFALAKHYNRLFLSLFCRIYVTGLYSEFPYYIMIYTGSR